MKSKFELVIGLFAASLVLSGLMLAKSKPGSMIPAEETAAASKILVAQQECSACENKCEAWVKKCKDGGQYACYKAAACLCKCNLDAGGCGSSKDALRECYEQNEKLARELGPE